MSALTRTPAFVAALAALLVALPSAAQALTDPTQPPNFSSVPGIGAAGPAAQSGPSLQSILLAPGRREAIIDGREVRVGDKVGEARVVAIEVDSVRLREGKETRVMKLIPDLQKSAARLTTVDAKADSKADPKSDTKLSTKPGNR